MTEPTNADITVTTVRKALIDESYRHRAAARRYSPLLKAGQNPTRADFDAFEGQTAAAAYSCLLAAVLRQIEAFSGTAEATEMARLCSAVMENGTEALEDANSDLDEWARAAGGLAFVKHDRVRATSGSYKGEAGTIAADVPAGNGAVARVLLDRAVSDGAIHIPQAHLELLSGPPEYPLGWVVEALDTLRAAVETLAGEVENLAQGGGSR